MRDDRLESTTIPPLDNPAAFDAWKREVMRNLGQLELAVKALERRGDLGAMRAAMLLVGAAPERARTYATQALGGDDIRIHLLAEAHLAVLQAHAAWTGQATPKFDARSVPIVLERILAEAKSLRDYSTFGRELIMRVHHMLADAYLISGAMERVREHAAELSHLAFTLDLPGTRLAANYYLAQVAESDGQPALAEDLFRSVAEDPNAGVLGPRAKRARARLLIHMGDEDGAENLLDPDEFTPGTAQFHHTRGLRFLTLREAITPDLAHGLNLIPNRTAALISVYAEIACALRCEPGDDLPRMEHWHMALNHLRTFEESATSDRSGLDARILGAFVLLQLGYAGQALHRLPPTAEWGGLPTGTRAQAHFTLIEVLDRLLPESAEALLEALEHAARDLGQVEPRILRQIARRQRLLAPKGVALLGIFPLLDGIMSGKHQSTDEFGRLSREAILNVRTRPVEVYSRPSLRPTQAAWFTLEAFDVPSTSIKLYDGGGQRQALHHGLFLPFHHQLYWHWPVAPARLAFSLSCCAHVRSSDLAIRRATRALRRSHGFISPQMRESDISGTVERIDNILIQFEAGRITPEHAHSAILGERGA